MTGFRGGLFVCCVLCLARLRFPFPYLLIGGLFGVVLYIPISTSTISPSTIVMQAVSVRSTSFIFPLLHG